MFKVTEEYAKQLDIDGAVIGHNSEFENAIKNIISAEKPLKLIETGTYQGTGSTYIIASQLKELKLNSTFFSIECYIGNAGYARCFLKSKKLEEYVKVLYGLSIPKNFLPTSKQIEEYLESLKEKDLFVDHNSEDRVKNYSQEVSVTTSTDNLLLYCFEYFNYSPEFILLDSAGHLGFIEFKYVLSLLKHPCVIALDDTNHIKHFESMRFMKQSKNFQMITESNEKFGFCIAKFLPF